MNKEVTPEQYHEMQVSQQSRTITMPMRTVFLAIAGVLVVLASFTAGTYYQKTKQPVAADSGQQALLPNGAGDTSQVGPGGSRMMSGAVGSVTAVDSESITISDARSGTSKTFTITSDTKIANNGATVAASDITTGSTVIIEPSVNNAALAAQIILNPQRMMGPGGATSSDPDAL
jgi:hypothetical protein